MSSTTIEHVSGMGINGRYHVKRDGKTVAVIHRSPYSSGPSWMLVSVYYDERLGLYDGLTKARLAAVSFDVYPTVDEVYARICERKEQERRRWQREKSMDALADAALDLANGVIGAHNRLITLARETEAFAKDRSDTDRRHHQNDQRVYGFADVPIYPKPPAIAYPTEKREPAGA